MISRTSALRRLRRALCSFRGRAALALLALVCAGCGPSEPKADLVIVNGAEPETLDPHLNTGQPDGRIVDSLFEGVTRLDPVTALPVPGLAERWEVSPDGRQYTFFLRSNARWSTGEPITAEDVVYSWRRALAPETAADYAGLLYCILNAEAYNRGFTNRATGRPCSADDLGIHAPTPNVVRVELEAPTPFFLNLCALRVFTVLPASTVRAGGDRWMKIRPLPTSGAYQLDSWRVNHKVRLRRNPMYWDAANTRSEVVDLLSTDQPNVALNLYVTGQADIVWDKNLVPTELFDRLKLRPDCHISDFLGSFFLRFNVTRAPFSDVRVRRAFALAVDRSRITTRITRGGEKPCSHFTPAGIRGYEPPAGLPFDPASAARSLAEAGHPGGRGFPATEYLMNSSRMDEQIGVELQDMWQKALGVRVELRQVEWKVFLNDQSRTNYQISRSSWVADYQDPNTFLDLFTSNNGNNRTGWSHPPYDDLIAKANREIDPARRMSILLEAEKILVRDQLPIIPLFAYSGVEFYDAERVKGVFANPLGEHPLRAIARLKSGPPAP
jgi:oligopeptide transport system substrate-binding protein